MALRLDSDADADGRRVPRLDPRLGRRHGLALRAGIAR
jgi:hypothetical protein